MQSFLNNADGLEDCEEDFDVPEYAIKDIEFFIWSMKLYKIRRYNKQRFWTEESRDAFYASKIEGGYRLESVAEHSWHVADCCLALLGRFPSLNERRVLELAIVHDKLEIITGDENPIGRDGTGLKTHAFNTSVGLDKAERETKALQEMMALTNHEYAARLEGMLKEYSNCTSDEAKFVKAVDKLQPLFYIIEKKQGILEDKHISFTFKYADKALVFPGIESHLNAAKALLIRLIAGKRGVSEKEIYSIAYAPQLDLFKE